MKTRARKVNKNIDVKIYDKLMDIYEGKNKIVNSRYKLIQLRCEIASYR